MTNDEREVYYLIVLTCCFVISIVTDSWIPLIWASWVLFCMYLRYLYDKRKKRKP